MSTARVATSIVTQPVGSQAKPSVLTRAALAVRKEFFTSADLTVPERLYRVVRALQDNVGSALQSLASNPTLAGVLLAGNVFGNGQTLTISHGLGRPYRGWYVARARGAAAVLVEAALPTGMTAAQAIALTSTNAGTYDLFVF